MVTAKGTIQTYEKMQCMMCGADVKVIETQFGKEFVICKNKTGPMSCGYGNSLEEYQTAISTGKLSTKKIYIHTPPEKK